MEEEVSIMRYPATNQKFLVTWLILTERHTLREVEKIMTFTAYGGRVLVFNETGSTGVTISGEQFTIIDMSTPPHMTKPIELRVYADTEFPICLVINAKPGEVSMVIFKEVRS